MIILIFIVIYCIDPYVDETDVWGAAPETFVQGGSNIPITRTEVNIIPIRKVKQDTIVSVSETIQIPEAVESPATIGIGAWIGLGFIDTSIDYFVRSIDDKLGIGHGHHVSNLETFTIHFFKVYL